MAVKDLAGEEEGVLAGEEEDLGRVFLFFCGLRRLNHMMLPLMARVARMAH